MSTTAQGLPKITGPGLKKEGVVILQAFFIAFFCAIELLFRSGPGIITGVIICFVLFGGETCMHLWSYISACPAFKGV